MKIKISNLTLTMMLLCGNMSFAQTSNVDELKKEITNLQHQLSAEKEKTAYLKEALDLRSNGKEFIQDSISIKITAVEGNLNSKSITVKGLVTYLGNIKRNIQFPQQVLLDPKGNIFETFTAVQLNDLKKDIFIQDVEKDIPYGFAVIFKKIEEQFPTASLLRLQIYGNGGAPDHKFNFKGIDITWK